MSQQAPIVYTVPTHLQEPEPFAFGRTVGEIAKLVVIGFADSPPGADATARGVGSGRVKARVPPRAGRAADRPGSSPGCPAARGRH